MQSFRVDGDDADAMWGLVVAVGGVHGGTGRFGGADGEANEMSAGVNVVARTAELYRGMRMWALGVWLCGRRQQMVGGSRIPARHS